MKMTRKSVFARLEDPRSGLARRHDSCEMTLIALSRGAVGLRQSRSGAVPDQDRAEDSFPCGRVGRNSLEFWSWACSSFASMPTPVKIHKPSHAAIPVPQAFNHHF
jgi:hypothetical protein